MARTVAASELGASPRTTITQNCAFVGSKEGRHRHASDTSLGLRLS